MEILVIKDNVIHLIISANALEDVAPFYDDAICVQRTGNESIGDMRVGDTWVTPPKQSTEDDYRITNLAFLKRFTDEEAINIDLASQGLTPQAAMLRRAQKKIEAASFICLKDADTIQGVQTLEAVGLLAAGRSAEILSLIVHPSERYLGIG